MNDVGTKIRIVGSDGNISITVKNIIEIKEYDLAIIIINYLEGIPLYEVGKIRKNDLVSVVGYPNGLKGTYCKYQLQRLEGDINSFPNKNIIEVHSHATLETNSEMASDIVPGFSGGGIFYEVNEEVYLGGIISDLKSPTGIFDMLIGKSISIIEDIVSTNQLPILFSRQLSGFSIYKDAVLELLEANLKGVLGVQMQYIRESISPIDIVNKLQDKLVWPYDDRQYQNEKIWEGWLLFLMYRTIEDKTIVEKGLYLKTLNNRNIKFMYVLEKVCLSQFIKEYLISAYDEIGEDDFIIVNGERLPSKVYFRPKEIEGIVDDISEILAEKNEIYIDSVRVPKNISVMHIQKLSSEIADIAEPPELKGVGLQEALRNKVREIFEQC